MGSIHVIYDPRDKIEGMRPADLISLKVSVATLTVPDQMSDEMVEHMAAQLARMVMGISVPACPNEPIEEGHPIWEAIDRGGGQVCDIRGVLRVLDERGFKIVAK